MESESEFKLNSLEKNKTGNKKPQSSFKIIFTIKLISIIQI